jgi:cytochrome d ubiquinol oxidase subunit II
MTLDLPFIWAGLIAFVVIAYVVLDGFDLGVGILSACIKDEAQKNDMMNSIAPIWDGNETWLVLGGGGLFAVFPLAYSVIMPALYAPIIAMLLALIFRGVAFEFRAKSTHGRFLWDWAFAGGSTVAALCQGIALGALVQGIPVRDGAYAGGWWDWLTPFSLLTGAALVVGYGLLGSTWLIYKTDGALQAKAYRFAFATGAATVLLIGAVSVWTPFLKASYMARWLGWPEVLYTAPVPLMVAALTFVLARSLREQRELTPFLSALGLFFLCYVGIAISFYPYIVPVSVTIWDAASPDSSLAFLLVGATVLIPIILAYTSFSYWVFRGKVNAHPGGYH